MKKFRKFIGPSQMGTIIGVDEFNNVTQLKDEIENGYVPNSNYATQYGINFESIAIYYYQKLTNTITKKPKFVVDQLNKHVGGICDAIIDDDTGLEIKCHVKEENMLDKLPTKYLIQITGYMYLYNRKNWVLMSCCFNDDKTLKKYKLFKVTWDDVKDRWNNDWYPSIIQFVNSTKWLM